MNEKDLSRTLLNQAITLGLCQPWQQSWGTPDQQGLIDKWLHGIDFAIKHNYPTNTFIKENFDKDILHKTVSSWMKMYRNATCHKLLF